MFHCKLSYCFNLPERLSEMIPILTHGTRTEIENSAMGRPSSWAANCAFRFDLVEAIAAPLIMTDHQFAQLCCHFADTNTPREVAGKLGLELKEDYLRGHSWDILAEAAEENGNPRCALLGILNDFVLRPCDTLGPCFREYRHQYEKWVRLNFQGPMPQCWLHEVAEGDAKCIKRIVHALRTIGRNDLATEAAHRWSEIITSFRTNLVQGDAQRKSLALGIDDLGVTI